MRGARLLAAAAAAGITLIAAPASAQQVCTTDTSGTYPITTCVDGDLSVTTVNINGEDIIVHISVEDGFYIVREGVRIFVNSTPQFLGTFQANDRGGLEVDVTLPDNLELGAHTITATGVQSGRTATLPFQVVATGGAGAPLGQAGGGTGTGTGGDGLVRTGSSSTIPLATTGVTLVMLGAAIVVVARRRAGTAPLAV